jgi:hypothetical protein
MADLGSVLQVEWAAVVGEMRTYQAAGSLSDAAIQRRIEDTHMYTSRTIAVVAAALLTALMFEAMAVG